MLRNCSPFSVVVDADHLRRILSLANQFKKLNDFYFSALRALHKQTSSEIIQREL